MRVCWPQLRVQGRHRSASCSRHFKPRQPFWKPMSSETVSSRSYKIRLFLVAYFACTQLECNCSLPLRAKQCAACLQVCPVLSAGNSSCVPAIPCQCERYIGGKLNDMLLQQIRAAQKLDIFNIRLGCIRCCATSSQ